MVANKSYTEYNEIYEQGIKVFFNGKFQIDSVYCTPFEQCDKVDFIENCYRPSGTGFEFWRVIVNKSLSDEHPPLYYLILHTVCVVTHSSNMYAIGFSINILFLLLTSLLIFKVTLQLKQNVWLALLTVFVWGASFAFINSVTYCRMYCLCAFEIMLLLYLHLKLVAKNWVLDNKLLVAICFVEYIAMLTHYFSLFYILPLFVITKRHVKNRFKYLKYSVVTAILYLICWPQCIFCLFMRLGVRAGLDFNVLYRLGCYSYNTVCSVFADSKVGLVMMAALFLLILICEYRNPGFFKKVIRACKCSGQFIITLIPVIVYFLITLVVSPWTYFRYMFPIIPIVVVSSVLLIYEILCMYIKNRDICILTIFAAMFLSFIFSLGREKIDYLYENTDEKISFQNKYKDYVALVGDDLYDIAHIQIIENYTHKHYKRYESSENHDDLVDEKFLLYFNDKYRHKVDSSLTKLPYTVIPIDYKSDWFSVYELNRNVVY